MLGYVNNIFAGMRMPKAACLSADLVRMPDRRANYLHSDACLNRVLMSISIRQVNPSFDWKMVPLVYRRRNGDGSGYNRKVHTEKHQIYVEGAIE